MIRKAHHLKCLWSSWALAVGAALALTVFAVWFGNLNQDEGWYLYAAQRVAEGAVPYRDFFFTQGPVMPYIYGGLSGLWSPFGVLGARVLTACLGLLGCVLTGLLARRAVTAERAAEAGIMAFALTACNVYHVYYTTIPKTYALCSCLVMGGYLLLSYCVSRRKKTRSMMSTVWALPAGFLIALAAGTRISLGALLPVTVVGLLLTVRRTGAAFFWFGLGGGLGLLLIYGPFLVSSQEPFLFAQSFHAARGGRDLFFILGSVARLVRFYLPLALMALALILTAIFRERRKEEASVIGSENHGIIYGGGVWRWLWLASFAGVFLVQLASPYPYDDYQVPVMGLLAAALSAWVADNTHSGSVRGRWCLSWTVVALLTTFGSQLPQEWLIERQDRFWAIRKPMSDLALLRQTARDVRALAEGDTCLLTQDVYLAVEARMKVPEGLEMGPFSYFPDLPDDVAKRFKVLNKKGMLALLERAPGRVAAVSGYGFAVRSPVMDRTPEAEVQQFWSALIKGYDRVDEIPGFGQQATLLQLFRRRDFRPSNVK